MIEVWLIVALETKEIQQHEPCKPETSFCVPWQPHQPHTHDNNRNTPVEHYRAEYAQSSSSSTSMPMLGEVLETFVDNNRSRR